MLAIALALQHLALEICLNVCLCMLLFAWAKPGQYPDISFIYSQLMQYNHIAKWPSTR